LPDIHKAALAERPAGVAAARKASAETVPAERATKRAQRLHEDLPDPAAGSWDQDREPGSVAGSAPGAADTRGPGHGHDAAHAPAAAWMAATPAAAVGNAEN